MSSTNRDLVVVADAFLRWYRVTVRCEAFAVLGVKSQQGKCLSIGEKEDGKTERPWALFQETPTGKARLSY